MSLLHSTRLYFSLPWLYTSLFLALLRKWNSNDPAVLQHIPPEFKDSQTMHTITEVEMYTKTLGIEWNTNLDHFRLTIADLPPLTNVTKRLLVSDIAKTFDVLGWFSPAIVKVKILLQRLWELKVDWDDPVPQLIKDVWLQWRSELQYLSHLPVLLPQRSRHRIYSASWVFRCIRRRLRWCDLPSFD